MSRNYPTQAEELANTAVVEAARLAFGQVVLAAVIKSLWEGKQPTLKEA